MMKTKDANLYTKKQMCCSDNYFHHRLSTRYYSTLGLLKERLKRKYSANKQESNIMAK
jgi:hypothetical protein